MDHGTAGWSARPGEDHASASRRNTQVRLTDDATMKPELVRIAGQVVEGQAGIGAEPVAAVRLEAEAIPDEEAEIRECRLAIRPSIDAEIHHPDPDLHLVIFEDRAMEARVQHRFATGPCTGRGRVRSLAGATAHAPRLFRCQDAAKFSSKIQLPAYSYADFSI